MPRVVVLIPSFDSYHSYPVLAPEGVGIAEATPVVEQVVKTVNTRENLAANPYELLVSLLTPLGFEAPTYCTTEGEI